MDDPRKDLPAPQSPSVRDRDDTAQLPDADRRQDAFVATLAHELRNPLAPIRQAVRIARSASATQAQRTWSLDVIERQVNTMALLLDDLLDLSQVARGHIALRKEAVPVAALLEAAIEVARPAIDAKQHMLSVSMPPPGLRVMADPLRLTQVFANLLLNAAKYGEPNGAIRVFTSAPGADTVAVHVSDSGIGLPPEMLDRVFDMFVQVQAGQAHRQGGLGIGLALAKGLVELHGGGIAAHSGGSGQGAEFVVCLPLLAADGTQAAAAPAAGSADSAARPRRVLVADDNADARESLTLLLQMAGHTVDAAPDGEQAWRAAQASRPDVCILDIAMPGIDGFELARRIRTEPWGERATLVALTGFGDTRSATETAAAGFDHHCTKPVDPEALKLLIARPGRHDDLQALALAAGEVSRLDELKRLAVLDSSDERAYDDITRLAAQMCDVPMALITLVDDTRQWFKSRLGIQAQQTPKEGGFCTATIEDAGRILVIPDTLQDPRFEAHPMVTGEPHIRFYAGAPLVTAAGQAIGSVCVIDRKPREMNAAQLETLRFLAQQVVSMLESRVAGDGGREAR